MLSAAKHLAQQAEILRRKQMRPRMTIRVFLAVLAWMIGGVGASCVPAVASLPPGHESLRVLDGAHVPDDPLEGRASVNRSGSAPDLVREKGPPRTMDAAIERRIVYGWSVEGRPLVAYRLGDGPVARALVGGIHGGYEWNTTALMSKTLEYFASRRDQIPPELTLYVVPLANPDGAAAGTDRVHGRMNANRVDLNRNWDYQWQMTATHGTWPVFAGAHPFSEPETTALREFILDRQIDATVFYHSAAGEVYSGAGAEASQTVALAKWLAQQTGYRYAPEGIPGQITTGNSIDWLTHQGITAVEVELSTHETLDWEINLRGLRAFLYWNLPEMALD